MSVFRIEGGHSLTGIVRTQGAKNSVLPILAAAFLSPGECVIHNCPRLTDVEYTLEILHRLGCRVEQEGETVTVSAAAPTSWKIPDELMREMRSSVIFLGAILGRMGRAELSYPGGCELGPRPIDLHLAALRTLGAEIDERGGRLACQGKLIGADITLSLPSVGATENIMLAAVRAEGITTITNAAREPEIVDLQNFLNTLGAEVRGAGSSVITVRGGQPLHGGEHTIIGDRIAAATCLSAVAAAGGEAQITGVDWRHLSTVTAALSEAGCRIESAPDAIAIRAPERLRAVRPIRTAPYPGFPTDAQAIIMAAMCTAEGATVFAENIFDSRYRHVDELVRMGADIRVEGKVAVVCGVPKLFGAQVTAADLRGGAALAVAALGAEGETILSGLRHVRRGYADLPADLRALGAKVTEEEFRDS
ncbi:MAG: UDP-N-acetylglucosamine 1-carboxyvinyltransferase [Pseudoflavonifractor sp.]|nr:UDP-N-acetylglucosamine 1-carboxyvinyltransferase [Pseudoflavonifractor sp.]